MTAGREPPPELSNPERDWERPEAVLHITREELEARLGSLEAPVEVLSGGLGNLNVRVGERVLRIYRRDRNALAVEAALLARGWQTFRVPRLLERGADHLVLEYVPHERLRASSAHGYAIGLALAEIHAQRYQAPGFLDGALGVAAPFAGGVDDLFAYAERELAGVSAELAAAARRLWPRAHAALEVLPAPCVLLHGDFKLSNLHAAGDGRLLVLDWEFAHAGPPLFDIGQFMRWTPPLELSTSFERGYREGGGCLPHDFCDSAQRFDLVNLCGLLAGCARGSRRARDVLGRIESTVRELAP